MPEDKSTNSDDVLAEIASSLATLCKDLSSVISLLYVKAGYDYKTAKDMEQADWDATLPGQLIKKYLGVNKYADKSIEEIIEEAKKQPNPELYELCRIENALTFIYGALTGLTGGVYNHYLSEYFPYYFKG